MNNQNALKQLLNENLMQLSKAAEQLQISYQRCNTLLITNVVSTDVVSIDDQEKLEALTSRFARLADLIIQKSIRLIENIELENTGSVLDRINKAEKKGFINNAEQFIAIRLLRNSIAHEYDLGSLTEIFQTCLDYSPALLDAVQNIQNYVKQHADLVKYE